MSRATARRSPACALATGGGRTARGGEQGRRGRPRPRLQPATRARIRDFQSTGYPVCRGWHDPPVARLGQERNMGPRSAVRVALLLTAFAPAASAGEFDLHGFGAARGVGVGGQPSWLEGGFGRLTEGAQAPGDSAYTGRALLHAGLDWKPSASFLLHLQGIARAEPSEAGGDRIGVPEAYAVFRPELSATLSLQLKGGLFFPEHRSRIPTACGPRPTRSPSPPSTPGSPRSCASAASKPVFCGPTDGTPCTREAPPSSPTTRSARSSRGAAGV